MSSIHTVAAGPRVGEVGTSLDRARAAVAARLRERQGEIEGAVLVRAAALLEAGDSLDPQFLEGQRAAVAAAVDYGLTAVELGEERSPPVPAIFHSRARQTARSGVRLDTMLRRYFAGYTLLSDFVVQEAETYRLERAALQSVMRDTGAVFERLIETMADEYMREVNDRLGSGDERSAARIRKLLDGELLDTSEFGYEFNAWHVGALVVGRDAEDAIRELACALDRRSLLVREGDRTIQAWLSGRRSFDVADVERVVDLGWPGDLTLALGEPGHGLEGWRQTHRQARAALPIALRRSTAVRYGDVALLASMLQDNLLTTSLRSLYLDPLSDERDGGKALRQTLSAYFAAEGNASSAAAALGVSRRTVGNRLRTAEDRLGRQLSSIGAELAVALQLDELRASPVGTVVPRGM
jgi:PucR C-terminal helix-turn-helix domain/GGDEF-like domain